MKYKALFCDLDGTILDTLLDLVDAVNHALLNHHYPKRSVEEIRSFLGDGSFHLIKKALPHEVEKETFQKVFEEYKSYYKEHCSIKTLPYPGIKKLLSDTKNAGLKLVIITNKPQDIADILVEMYFPHLFDLVYGQSAKIKTKPNPESIELAKSILKLETSDIFYFGDSLVDVMTAKNAKLEYAIVSYGFVDKIELERAGIKHIVDTVDELWPLIA